MVCKGHKGIVAALKTHDPEKASKAMLNHIKEVEKGMLDGKNGTMIITDNGLVKKTGRSLADESRN